MLAAWIPSNTNQLPSDYIAHLDGFTEIQGGWLNHHWIQLAYQLADSAAGFAYSFCGSCIILFLMNLIPGLGLRASEEAEVLGMDDAEIGEFAVSALSPFYSSLHAYFASMTTLSLHATWSTAMPWTRLTPSTLPTGARLCRLMRKPSRLLMKDVKAH